MNAKDGFHREPVEQSILDHLASTAATFFGRLEDQVHRTVEIAMSGQVLGGRKQHGRMPVMTTRVHRPAVHAGVIESVALRDWQPVHVRA